MASFSTTHTYLSIGQQSLRKRYSYVRAQTETLSKPLEPEDYVVQSMPDASPVKWHLAHTTWFFETFVLNAVWKNYRQDPVYAYLFNSYYYRIGNMYERSKRGMITRPTVEEIMDYRRGIDEKLLVLLESENTLSEPVRENILLGLHHEQQHQELILTDLKHLIFQNPILPVYQPAKPALASDRPAKDIRWIDFEEDFHEIGAPDGGFAFDNERPRHKIFLPSFQIADRLVSNQDYFAFIEDGGYHQPQYWLSEGWALLQREGWTAPLYWRKKGEEWVTCTLSGERPVDRFAPVCHVSYFEADAYARWAGARLATEAEWEVASTSVPLKGNFLEEGYLNPVAFDYDSKARIHQLFGDVWEWTQSPYTAYPGFQASHEAVGEYNGKFMCNQFVLRGGSCVTPQSHIRRSYRNFFQPDKRWQFTGIRLAKDLR